MRPKTAPPRSRRAYLLAAVLLVAGCSLVLLQEQREEEAALGAAGGGYRAFWRVPSRAAVKPGVPVVTDHDEAFKVAAQEMQDKGWHRAWGAPAGLSPSALGNVTVDFHSAGAGVPFLHVVNVSAFIDASIGALIDGSSVHPAGSGPCTHEPPATPQGWSLDRYFVLQDAGLDEEDAFIVDDTSAACAGGSDGHAHDYNKLLKRVRAAMAGGHFEAGTPPAAVARSVVVPGLTHAGNRASWEGIARHTALQHICRAALVLEASSAPSYLDLSSQAEARCWATVRHRPWFYRALALLKSAGKPSSSGEAPEVTAAALHDACATATYHGASKLGLGMDLPSDCAALLPAVTTMLHGPSMPAYVAMRGELCPAFVQAAAGSRDCGYYAWGPHRHRPFIVLGSWGEQLGKKGGGGSGSRSPRSLLADLGSKLRVLLAGANSPRGLGHLLHPGTIPAAVAGSAALPPGASPDRVSPVPWVAFSAEVALHLLNAAPGHGSGDWGSWVHRLSTWVREAAYRRGDRKTLLCRAAPPAVTRGRHRGVCDAVSEPGLLGLVIPTAVATGSAATSRGGGSVSAGSGSGWKGNGHGSNHSSSSSSSSSNDSAVLPPPDVASNATRRALAAAPVTRQYVTARSGWGVGRTGWDPGAEWMAAYKLADMPANPKRSGNQPTAASLPLRRCFTDCRTSRPGSKVAFLFITATGLVRPDVWRAFFQSASPTRFSVYVVHRDNPARVTRQFYPGEEPDGGAGEAKGSSVHGPARPQGVYRRTPRYYPFHYSVLDVHGAGYGDLAYARLVTHLLRAALGDPGNKRFVLLSEFDVPVASFDRVYCEVMADDYAWLPGKDPLSRPEEGEAARRRRWEAMARHRLPLNKLAAYELLSDSLKLRAGARAPSPSPTPPPDFELLKWLMSQVGKGPVPVVDPLAVLAASAGGPPPPPPSPSPLPEHVGGFPWFWDAPAVGTVFTRDLASFLLQHDYLLADFEPAPEEAAEVAVGLPGDAVFAAAPRQLPLPVPGHSPADTLSVDEQWVHYVLGATFGLEHRGVALRDRAAAAAMLASHGKRASHAQAHRVVSLNTLTKLRQDPLTTFALFLRKVTPDTRLEVSDIGHLLSNRTRGEALTREGEGAVATLMLPWACTMKDACPDRACRPLYACPPRVVGTGE